MVVERIPNLIDACDLITAGDKSASTQTYNPPKPFLQDVSRTVQYSHKNI